jgi:hypothetical protein
VLYPLELRALSGNRLACEAGLVGAETVDPRLIRKVGYSKTKGA